MLQVLMQTSEETAFLMSLQSVLSLSLLKFSCNFFLWNALSRSADLFTYWPVASVSFEHIPDLQ